MRLKDVATVRWGQKEQDVITRINGLESVEVEIYKEADSNTVKVADRVKEVLGLAEGGPSRAKGSRSAGFVERFMEDYPGVELKLISDPSRFIKRAIEEVRSTAFYGGILALLVLFFFLRDLKSTAIIGVSIPVSILVTFIPMFLFGVSLNLMSLGGLALGIGMLVDNSIVVLESIFRCREEGDGILDASNRGTGEVAAAITASTFTTVAVFFPIVFVKGIAGQLFNDLALTVTFSLLASLLVALYLIPMLASRRVGSEELTCRRRKVEGVPVGSVPGKTVLFPEGRRAGRAVGTAVKNAFRWLGENGRPDRWLREAGGFLAGGSWMASFGSTAFSIPCSRPCGLSWDASSVCFRGRSPLSSCWGGAVLLHSSPSAARVSRALFAPFLFVFEKILQTASRVYPHVLGRALRWRAGVILVCVALFLHSLYLLPRLGTELIPRIHQGQFTIRIEQPAGTPLEETSRDAAPIEAMVLKEDCRRDRVQRDRVRAFGRGGPRRTARREHGGAHGDDGRHRKGGPGGGSAHRSPASGTRAISSGFRPSFCCPRCSASRPRWKWRSRGTTSKSFVRFPAGSKRRCARFRDWRTSGGVRGSGTRRSGSNSTVTGLRASGWM